MRNRDKPASPTTMWVASENRSFNGDVELPRKQEKYEFAGTTKLEDLAMRLYAKEVAQRDMCNPVSLGDFADFAIAAANAFYDELEKGNE